MKWSLKIARIAGIDVYVHATFLLLVAWLALGDLFAGRGARAAAEGLVTLLVLFGIIVLHELGHALTARRFGVKTAHITLLPIGGVAAMEEIPRDPLQELLIAIAGPLVNVALAVLALVAMALSGGFEHIGNFGDILPRLFWSNVILAVFNMLPAFPMDGGRVLRALLSMRINRVRATEVAAAVGQGFALILGLVGLFANPMLMFVALFVWVGAESEASMVREEEALAGLTVGDVMAREFHVVSPYDSLGQVAGFLAPSFQTDLPVVENGRLVGVLSLDGLIRAIAVAGTDGRVEQFMTAHPDAASPDEPLIALMHHWTESRGQAIPVLRDDSLVGLLTPTVVGEHILLRTALQRGKLVRGKRQGRSGKIQVQS